MLRLMLKDLAMLKRQKVMAVLVFFIIPSLMIDPLAVIAWGVFPVVVLMQSLEALDANGQESRLLRSLPLDAWTVVGARYLLTAAVTAVFVSAIFLLRAAIAAIGVPIPALSAMIAAFCAATALAYFALRNPLLYLLNPVKARWASAALLCILVAAGTAVSLMTSPLQPRTMGATLDVSGFLAFAGKPRVFMAALLAAAALYALSFLASTMAWKAKRA